MKPQPPPLKVGKPCPKLWSELTGDSKCRFCSECQLHVHNLSEMQEGERERFVAESGGQACIAYELNADGSMVTPPRWPWLARMVRPFKWAGLTALSAVLPFWFSGCATRRGPGPGAIMGVPMPPPPSASSASVQEAQGDPGPARTTQGEPGAPIRPMTLGKVKAPQPKQEQP